MVVLKKGVYMIAALICSIVFIIVFTVLYFKHAIKKEKEDFDEWLSVEDKLFRMKKQIIKIVEKKDKR